MKKLPIGIQTFKKIRSDDFIYIDKTSIAIDLIRNGSYYFLSRPRRFGKSLFIDTLKNIFECNKKYFKGLNIFNSWDWNENFPVINISFAEGVIHTRKKLDITIQSILDDNAQQHGCHCEKNEISLKFKELIKAVHDKYNKRVVILVDEYDKPILDNITDTDAAAIMRDGLRDLYSVIKGSDAFIKFVFITGVSKFSKVSIFSGLNNLQDITLDERYATICGYTQKDLETCFHEHLKGLNLEKIKKWYNGYSWLGERVYNPYDILLYLDSPSKELKNYWFETGTPTFLIDLLKAKKYFIPSIENIKAGLKILGSFEVENIQPETLLFQAGYLTIDKKVKLGETIAYTLKYPNLEVKYSLNDYILSSLSFSSSDVENKKFKLYDILIDNNIDEMKNLIHSFFASIPNDWYRNNSIEKYEGYYASVFYSYFASLGLDIKAEDTTNHGKIDMTLKFDDRIYIFEFKVVEYVKDKNSALQQIKDKKYYEKYLDHEDVYLVGIEFSKENRNITNFEWVKHK